MAAGRQLRLLLWKDYLIRKRNLITLGGIIWAVCVMSSLYIVRININNQDFPSCQFPARALPSAGVLTFMQSFICSVDNTCSPMDQYTEIPAYEKSKLTEVKQLISPLVNNDTVLDVAGMLPDALKLLATVAEVADNPLFVDISKNGLRVDELFKNPSRVKRYLETELDIKEDVVDSVMAAKINLEGIMQGNLDRCSEDSISRLLRIENKEHVQIFVSKLCTLTTKVLQKIVIDLLLEVNIGKYIKMAGDMYYKISGDDRISRIGDMSTAVLRMMSVKSFLPPEVTSIMKGEEVDFSYINLTMITQVMDLFKPTFGDTEIYKSLRDVTDTSILGVQFLHKILRKINNNTVQEVTDLTLSSINKKIDIDIELDKVTNMFKDFIGLLEEVTTDNTVDNFYNALSRATSFIYKFLSAKTKHSFLFYTTLFTKLVEGAELVVNINMNIEQVVYNVSHRNPEGVKVLLSLPSDIVGKGLEALADPETVQLLTANMDNPEEMFCDVDQVHKFFSLSKEEATKLKVHFCTDAWNNYMSDMIKSFGIFEVRDNINSIASLFVLETIGRDVTEYLYTIDKEFEVYKNFTRTLSKIESHKEPTLNWSKVLGVDEDSELMKKAREKSHLGNQMLITVNGALAKEVVKQSPLLEYKISPPLRDATTILIAINQQLNASAADIVRKARELYPEIIETILLTAMNENKTYRALSSPSEVVLCNGVKNAYSYLELPSSEVDSLVRTLCDMSVVINSGIQRNSIIGNAIATVKNTTHGPFDDIDWSLLIGALKELYLKLNEDYPYVFEYKTYGMNETTQRRIAEMVANAKDFWFSKKNINRSMHVSMKLLFSLLDLVDRSAFNVTSDKWLKLKYGIISTMGPLAATGDFLKLIGAISRKENTSSEVPASIAIAIRQILPNLPQLIVDTVDVIIRGDTDVEPIIEVMNADPPWPCSHNLSHAVVLSDRAQEALTGLETVLCMDRTLQEEWIDYNNNKNLTLYESHEWNTTAFPPHLFLKFSEVFTSTVMNLDALKDLLQSLFDSSDGISFVSSVEYAIDSFNVSNKDVILRNLFSKMDIVLSGINTTSVDETVPLNSIWRNYFRCSSGPFLEEYCWRTGRAAWKHTLKFIAVTMQNMAADLLTYFKENNESDSNVLKMFGFTSNTGLYALYDKFPEFIGTLLNSYWDLGFMNQVRRASQTQFWDCDAVLAGLNPTSDSPIDDTLIQRIKPFMCPSLLYWISLPRGDNILLDVVAKPQYFFFTIPVENLTSTYEDAFVKTTELANFVAELMNKTVTDLQVANEDSNYIGENENKIDKMRQKLEQTVDKILSFELTEDSPSYRLFNEANKKQFIASVYLTRITAIVNKLSNGLDNLKLNQTDELSEEELKKAETELTAIQKIFKRRPTETIALHFDALTDVLWRNDENYKLSDAITSMCNNLKNKDTSKDILSDTERVKLQICSKEFSRLYKLVQNVVDEDYDTTRASLLNLVLMLSDDSQNVTDIVQFFNERKQVVNALKTSIKYAYDLSIPVYLKYLHSNIQQYHIVVSFLTGDDWWADLRQVYSGPHVTKFIDALERTFDIAEDVLTNLDKIHLVRLLRDMNTNSTEAFCRDNVTLSDYAPDGTGLLSALKQQACDKKLEIVGEIPPLLFASQGYVNELKLSDDVDYAAIYSDVTKTETKLLQIRTGPKNPMRPSWITDEKIAHFRATALNLLSKETLTKISFGVLSNMVDAGTIYLNNSQCTLCSQFTTWFKQINLQLYKKQEYDNLLCHMDQMTLEEIHLSLKNDFHWDMALSELISTRNYTKYELNKSMNEFLELVKLHLLDDVTSDSSKIAQCLNSNVTANVMGNVTLFLQVLTRTIRLLRAELPHLQEVPGIKDLKYFKELLSTIAHNLDVEATLKDYVMETNDLSKDIMKIVGDKSMVEDIENAKVNLRKVRDLKPTNDHLKLKRFNWTEICQSYNCADIMTTVHQNINQTLVGEDLPKLQGEKFWQFNFISELLAHEERLLGDAARILGVVSRADLGGVVRGQLAPLLNLAMQLLMDESLDSIVYSLRGILHQLRPVLAGTPLEYDVEALASGLIIFRQYKNYLLEEDLKVEVSQLFPYPERLEAALTELGINNTNFWSIAAPRIHAGQIVLTPIFAPKDGIYHIESFVCQLDAMSTVLVPGNVDVVTLDDIYGAVAEQFCGMPDHQAKEMLPVLAQNINISLILDKVKNTVLAQLFDASNLTQPEGDRVLNSFSDMAELLPTMQENFSSLTESLADEPLLRNFRNSSSVNTFITSPNFMAETGRMLCGRPFHMDVSRYYKVISSSQDMSSEPDQEQLDVLPTDFCRSLYKEIVRMKGGKIVWSFAKPLIIGKILYTPDTPAVRTIIQKANSTFSPMVKLTSLIHSFANAFSSLESLRDHREGMSAFASLLSTPGSFRDSIMGGAQLGDIDVEEMMEGLEDIEGYKNVVTKASDLLHCINMNRFQSVKDEDELKLEAGRLTRVNEFSAGVVFLNMEEDGEIPENIEYKIRMDIENAPTTKRLRNYLWIPGPEASFLEDMRYFRGFVQIQDIIDKAIIELSLDDSRRIQKREAPEEKDWEWAVYTQQIPYPCYRKDFFQTTLYETQSLMVAFFFSMLFTVTSAVRFIVADKESGNTTLMAIMGVKLRHHTLSWFLASSLEMAGTVAAMTAVLCAGRVLPRTDPSLVLALLLLYGFSVVTFCYMMSKMFNVASFAAVCTGLGVLTTYMPFILILSLEGVLLSPIKIFVCLFMSSAMTYGMWFITRFEAMGVGAHWGQIWETMEGSEMTLAYAMGMVFIDALIYAAIGFVIDRYFGFKPYRNNIDCTNTGEKAGVSIINVSKIYNEGTRRAKLALDNVSIELEKGQITTLLGHNGAGKTTLINILTGAARPTSGTVALRAAGAARLGVCPQHDVLFEQLTAREHVQLYAQLKARAALQHVREEVDSILRVLSLGAAADERASRLSGGTRRRLCVALAFVARPALVSLDEPTAGVDPAARREIWSMIMKLRENRTILLTTHHLDEAELLSDQIVIMHKGQIHTIGSPIDIKRSLGSGYKLTVMYPDKQLHIQDEALQDDVCIEEKTKQLLAVTRNVIKNANLVDVNGLEVEVNLPFFDPDGVSNNFLELCKVMEAGKNGLGYRSFEMDCSSLEQVFFQICNQADISMNSIEYDGAESSKSASSGSARRSRGPLVRAAGPRAGPAARQLLALLRARALHYARNRWLLFMLIILPSLFVSIAMGFSTIRPPADTEIALKLTRDLYEPTTDFIVPDPSIYSKDIDDTLARRVMDILHYEKQFRNWTSEDSPTCQCVDTVHQCDLKNYTVDRPEMMVLPDVDTLNNWLIDSQQVYIQKRYGGFTSALYDNVTRVVAWYNNKGHHALPAYLNAVNSALLRAARGPRANITLYTHPLKISNEQLSKASAYQHVADAGVSCMLLLGYSLASAGAAVPLVAARRRREKRLQLLSGVPPVVYWGAALVADLAVILVNLAITATVLAIFQFPVFVYGKNLAAISVLIVLYGYACASLIHVMEKLFHEPSMANMMLFCGNTFVGVVGITILLILDIISESETTDNARWLLHKVLLLSPQFALGDGLLQIATNTIQALVLKQFGMDTYKNPLASTVTCYHFIALVTVGTALLLFNLALEYNCFDALLDRFRNQPAELAACDDDEDAGVAAERVRVRGALAAAAQPLRLRTIGNINAGFVETEVESKAGSGPIVLADDVAACVALTKRRGKKIAVRGLTLGIPPGQCTALLGQNGAGKSTTFAMLTGEVRPTAGQLYLGDRRVTERDLCNGLVSYCPQNDAIDPLLTVTETLQIYCRLRGISDEKEVIQRTIEMFDLSKYAHVRAGALSGGNKRKLSAALAFMGRAPLVLLDEPTSGMDPVSRACVSRGVRAACGAARGVLLSTHALDDARRLAARVALMRAGRLCALAPLDECLKRFGGGHVVACRVRAGGARAAWARLRARAPLARLRVLHRAALHCLLPAHATVDKKDVTIELSDVFALMAELQAAGDIEDYTINQSSLDQMFLNFTENSKEDLEPVDLESLPVTRHERKYSDELNSVTAL
ncbi:uncharacterized protein ldd [Epargyreus clarus]|uniref:uncharacterized protein ldd n=1 Tax=Epargyreus clarus TaxID=520877 RepID=UPI003C2CDCF4